MKDAEGKLGKTPETPNIGDRNMKILYSVGISIGAVFFSVVLKGIRLAIIDPDRIGPSLMDVGFDLVLVALSLLVCVTFLGSKETKERTGVAYIVLIVAMTSLYLIAVACKLNWVNLDIEGGLEKAVSAGIGLISVSFAAYAARGE